MCFTGQVVLSGLFSLWALCPAAIFLKGNLAMSFLFHFRDLCKAVTLLFCIDGGYSLWQFVYNTKANFSFKLWKDCDPLNMQYDSYFLLPTLKSRLWGGSNSETKSAKCSGLYFKKVNTCFLSQGARNKINKICPSRQIRQQLPMETVLGMMFKERWIEGLLSMRFWEFIDAIKLISFA